MYDKYKCLILSSYLILYLLCSSFLTSLLVFLRFCLFLGYYPRILLNFFKHLFELFHDLLINPLDFIIIYLLVYILQFINLPTYHQIAYLLCQICYSYVFYDHLRYVCQMRIMLRNLFVFIYVFLEISFTNSWFLL